MRALVTSSGQRHRVLQRILDRPGLWSAIFYAGALYYAYFILDYRNAEHTRISEHALMPGLVIERFDKDGLAVEYLQELREHVIDKQDFICRMMKEARLLCHTQRWWSTTRVTNVSGTNVYAVLRAPRATGVESMVFVVDLKQREAAAIVMAYAAFARQQVYWARDLFFVFVDGGAPAMDAWLSEYHMVPHTALQGEPLAEMGGVIIGGVVMKSQMGLSPSSVRIELNHLNGQLPNLDLFNSVVRIAGNGKFSMNSVVYDVYDIGEEFEDWHMLVPLRAIYTQAFVAVEGVHSVMGKYGVQALTVVVPALKSISVRKAARLLEAIARALNNVLERFHQSYFLYILASPDNFVSIAYFMPIIGGVLLPLLIFAYRDWSCLSSIVLPQSLIVMHTIGFFTWCFCCTYFPEYTLDPRAEVIYLGVFMMVPWGLIIAPSVSEICSLRFFLLLECCLAAAAVSLLNFSLALCYSIVAVPLLVKCTQDNDSRSRALARTALVLLCHPAGMYALFLVYGAPLLKYSEKPITLSIDKFSTVLLRLLKEHLVYGSHTLPLLLILVLPMWNLLLPLALVKIKTVTRDSTEEEKQDIGEKTVNNQEQG